MKRFGVILLLLMFCTPGSLGASDEARLLRFPAIYKDKVIFTYAGDLYTVSSKGGVARKLTNDDGFEMFARFSPDGGKVAFTGQYDGNTEIYLMPSSGGVPKRLTYTATLGRDDVSDRMGPNNIVMGWTPDGGGIVFRSRMHEPNSFIGQLYEVSVDGGVPAQLPLPRGGFNSYSPDGSKLAYNRIFREFRTWKRYRGGMADDVWIYDFTSKQVTNITNNDAQNVFPMWKGGKIYFLSDRDENKRMNLYSYDLETQREERLTNFSEFDIKFPTLGVDAIVFEYGGYIYRFALETGNAEKLSIFITEDLNSGRGGIVELADKVSNYEISPDGNRALFGARGEVFTVPAKHGNTRNLTNSSGVHERNSKWSPDGKLIAFVSDASGENEIWTVLQDGSAPAKQLTKGADTYYYGIQWSPDSKKILWSDKKQRLRFVDLKSGKVTEVDKATAWEIRSIAWSPDSKWIAYCRPEEKSETKLYVYSLDSGKSKAITDGNYSSNSPAFSSDGKYLFFVSTRDFNPIYSWTEWNHVYVDMDGIYLVTLNKKVESPFKPESDEVEIDGKDDEEEKDKKKDKDKKVDVKIDFEGIGSRIVKLPISASNYSSLASAGDAVYYRKKGRSDDGAKLVMYDLSEKEETELGEIDGYEISADGKKMLVGKNGSYYIISLPKSKLKLEDKLDLSDMEMKLDRKAMWAQIYEECWRQLRDFFYVPNMHGVDWKAIGDKYRPLVEYVNHRADLTYVLGEMVGELSIGHTYVGGGDRPKPERIQTGQLGAEISRDMSSGYYRIDRILPGRSWEDATRSPLTAIGVEVNEGDYVIAVNGAPTREMPNIYESLVNTVGKQVTLTLNSKPSEKGARKVVIEPIANEQQLYYYKWVEGNRKKVDDATGGKVGYIHIPDMGVGGLNEFTRQYYPQLTKKGLIIDVRGNGGGNVSPMIIERLMREITMITIARNTTPSVNPGGMHWGPKVMLINEHSASDGDIVAYRFKKHNIGKLIGKRTWGGVVGIRGSLPLLDGGTLYKPEFSRYDVEGTKWIMEGVGVEPDIEVDNDPAREFAGIDDQLNKAIEVIFEELKTQEKEIPPPPKYPVK